MSAAKDHRGQIAEAGFVFCGLINDLVIWKPINPQLRYDFIVERGGKGNRVQVKSSWPEKGAWRVDLVKKRRIGGKLVTKAYTERDFDFLAVYHPEHRDFWIFPVGKIVSKTSIWCRTEQTRANNQRGFNTSLYWKAWNNFGV